jgi:putative transferase (TIGR04331 family)
MHILNAFKLHPDLKTLLLAPESFYTPWDMGDYVRLVVEDRYNLQIFSEILIALGVDFAMRSQDLYQDLYDDRVNDNTLSHKSLVLDKKSFRHLSAKKVPHVLMGEMCCDSPFLVQICQAMQSFGSYWSHQSRMEPFPKKTQISFDSRRLGLLDLKASSSFERLVIQTLPQNFPGLYLEGFTQAREMTYETFPSFPSVLVTLNDWYIGEKFKFLAAEASQLGSRLVFGQHGGLGYGGLKVNMGELHEQAVSDRYCVWGWSNNQNGYQNLPSFKTSFLLHFKTHSEKLWKQNSKVLLLSTCFFPYVAYKSSSPSNYEQVEFWNDLEIFLSSIPQHLQSHVLWRAKFPDYGMPERNIIESQFPEVKISDFKTWSDWARDYHPNLNEARIVVVNNCSTSAVESLVLNVPTILYWRSAHWPLRTEAEPYFDQLRQVGILWDNPQAAASHLLSIYEKPWVWWERQDVQEVRQRFVDKYGQASENWLDDWLAMFKEELSISMSAPNSNIQQSRNYTTPPHLVAQEPSFLNSLECTNHVLNAADCNSTRDIIKECYSMIRTDPYSSKGYENLAKVLQITGHKNSALRAYLKAEQLK